MRLLLILTVIVLFVGCSKHDNSFVKARVQDNLVPVPASAFGASK
jgi:hypothetical protein